MSVSFHLEFNPSSFSKKISIEDKIFLLGSCFTSHLHEKLALHKFNVMQNPHGILFNPISIFKTLKRYIECDLVDESELFHHRGIWNHWDFHSSCSDANKQHTLKNINENIQSGHTFLKNTDWLFITLGSALVYEFPETGIVANCHKYPTDQFRKFLLEPSQIEDSFNEMMNALKNFNNAIQIVFTVSPVRHLRDGFVENNRSKAVLFYTIDQIMRKSSFIEYFPAYELIIDDLRDYRFYAEDMVHPNYLATQYVWEKFVDACIEGKSQEVMKEIFQLQQAIKHRPLHPDSSEHLKFIEKNKELAVRLSNRLPLLDFTKELSFFA